MTFSLFLVCSLTAVCLFHQSESLFSSSFHSLRCLLPSYQWMRGGRERESSSPLIIHTHSLSFLWCFLSSLPTVFLCRCFFCDEWEMREFTCKPTHTHTHTHIHFHSHTQTVVYTETRSPPLLSFSPYAFSYFLFLCILGCHTTTLKYRGIRILSPPLRGKRQNRIQHCRPYQRRYTHTFSFSLTCCFRVRLFSFLLEEINRQTHADCPRRQPSFIVLQVSFLSFFSPLLLSVSAHLCD